MNSPLPPKDDCHWQDGNAKEDPNLISNLEERAQSGEPMEGFKLSRTNLAGIDLVKRGAHEGYRLINSDLYRANLQGAHCFMLDASGSSLMKANLKGANFHCANFENCNLLGTVFERAKIEHINWGDKLLQEKLAEQTKNHQEKLDYYQQAEEIYRHLRKVAEQQGLFDTAGQFFQREMLVRRFQMPLFSGRRVISKTVDLFCGYGEQPYKVVLFSISIIVVFSLLYFLFGITDGEQALRAGMGGSLWQEINYFLSCIYFSVVTFTTLGYGDLAPLGIARLFAASEAFLGSFTLALFVVVFVKKMTR